MTTQERFQTLLVSFPALKGADGLFPWDVDAFIRWTCSGKSHGELCAAQFVLSVWNPGTDWKAYAQQNHLVANSRLGPLRSFNVHEALGVWDNANRSAFLSWATEPFWP